MNNMIIEITVDQNDIDFSGLDFITNQINFVVSQIHTNNLALQKQKLIDYVTQNPTDPQVQALQTLAIKATQT